MADLLTVRHRLEQLILTSGHTFREVSLKIGRKDSYIQQYIKYGFPKRLNEMDRRKVCQFLGVSEEELLDDDLKQVGIEKAAGVDMSNIEGETADFSVMNIYTPRLDTPTELMVIGKIAINHKEVYEWFNGNPSHLKIFRQTGDSMEPTVPVGGLVINDVKQREYPAEGIYLIKYDNHLIAKRLQKYTSEHFIIKSENLRYQEIRCTTDEFEILGRAVNTLIAKPL